MNKAQIEIEKLNELVVKAQAGDDDAKWEIVATFQPLAETRAERIPFLYPDEARLNGYEFSESYNKLMTYLEESSITKFDPEQNDNFLAYVRSGWLRHKVGVPRTRKPISILDESTGKDGDSPTIGEQIDGAGERDFAIMEAREQVDVMMQKLGVTNNHDRQVLYDTIYGSATSATRRMGLRILARPLVETTLMPIIHSSSFFRFADIRRKLWKELDECKETELVL